MPKNRRIKSIKTELVKKAREAMLRKIPQIKYISFT